MRAIGYRTSAPAVGTPLLLAVYLVIGAFVAATHRYFGHLHVARQYGSAVLAVLLWPLLFLGINLHIH
jgi:Zn-dependent protease